MNRKSPPIKNILIWLCYGTMSLIFFLLESYSAFLFLLSISMELILLIVFYVFYRKYSQQSSTVDYMNVVYGAVPLLFINTIFFGVAGIEFDGNQFYLLNEYPTLFQPIVFYKWEIIALVIMIAAGYFFEFFGKKKQAGTTESMEHTLKISGLTVWVLGIISMIALEFAPTESYPVIVGVLLLIRAGIEFSFYRKAYKAA